MLVDPFFGFLPPVQECWLRLVSVQEDAKRRLDWLDGSGTSFWDVQHPFSVGVLILLRSW